MKNPALEPVRFAIEATSAELRALKRWWRTRPDERGDKPATRFELHPSKRRATLLCMIVAHGRGRLHIGRMAGLDEQAAALTEELDRMDAMSIQTPLLESQLREAARRILDARRARAA